MVILVHGVVISSRYMLPTAERLAPLCRVFAVDLPGYGKSFKPTVTLSIPELADALADWMNAIGIEKGHLVGNSFGCQIIAEFAVRYPNRVDRLVLQGPTVDPEARTFARQLARLWINSRREAPHLGHITRQDYMAAGLRRACATIKLALRDRIEERLPRVIAPTLVVRGTEDPLVPHAWAKRAASLLPHGTLHEIPHVAHTINYTAPRAFVRAIAPFLGLCRDMSGRYP
ncbi:MAG: alpha/beta fold hydrolase [Betaproteobacteria bacterium]